MITVMENSSCSTSAVVGQLPSFCVADQTLLQCNHDDDAGADGEDSSSSRSSEKQPDVDSLSTLSATSKSRMNNTTATVVVPKEKDECAHKSIDELHNYERQIEQVRGSLFVCSFVWSLQIIKVVNITRNGLFIR